MPFRESFYVQLKSSHVQLITDEHTEILRMFEREHTGRRMDKESKTLWPKGRIYQDGQLNELFLAYRKGYAFAKSVYQER